MRPHLGKHADTLSIPIIIQFLKYVFAAQLLYVIALAWIKLAILAFYWRLFSIKARWPVLITTGVVIAWIISGVSLQCEIDPLLLLTFEQSAALIFTCKPVKAQWDLTVTNAVCLDRRAVYLGVSLVNVVTDVVLLALPIPYIWNLHSPAFQRIVLVGIFSLGIFVSIVSIVRLTILMGLNLGKADITYQMSQVFIWSLVEVSIGLVCACLPSLRPAVRLLGLGRLFPSSSAMAQDAYVQQQTPQGSTRATDRSHTSKRNPFGFMTSMGGTKCDEEEEDSFQMINQQSGKNSTAVDAYRVPSSGSDDTTDRTPASSGNMQPITIEREWRVESRTPEEREFRPGYNAM